MLKNVKKGKRNLYLRKLLKAYKLKDKKTIKLLIKEKNDLIR